METFAPVSFARFSVPFELEHILDETIAMLFVLEYVG